MRIKRFKRKRSIKEKLKALFGTKAQKSRWNFRSKKPKKNKNNFFKWLLFFGVLFFWILVLYTYYALPDVKDSEQLRFVESTIIYDREALEKIKNNPRADLTENILYVIHGDEKRDFVPLEEISPWLRQATIAIEDERFYSHFGFDVQGILNAILGQIGLREERGGSTITQQLVKNTFLSSERSFKRKFNEILLAIKIELNYSKDEILELYLNKIDYGSNSQGVEVASQTFFGKSARDLSLVESSILASIPKAPTKYSPYGSKVNLLMGYNFDDKETGQLIYKRGRKDFVLQNLLNQGIINQEQFSQAFAEGQVLKFTRSKGSIRAPHFVFLVRQKLEEKYGKDFLSQGGLRIFTTLDPKLQNLAESVVEENSEKYVEKFKANNVALVSFDNRNGEILSYIGGRDFFDTENDGQVDVLTSLRQPGSSIKPFVYAAGFAKGFLPSTVLFDVETNFGGDYKPQNFDGKFAGPVSVRKSLNSSLNIPAVKMAYLAGVENVFDLLKKLGINIQGEFDQYGLSLALGSAEIQPLKHIAAYQVFANEGLFYEPTAILEIRDSKGKVLEITETQTKKQRGLEPAVANLVREILTDENSRPTTDDFDWNKLLQLKEYDNGAKTGTSNRMVRNTKFNPEKPENEKNNPRLIRAPSDAWTIGFTPHLTTGVWVGNNRGQAMSLGATGMTIAAPIWKKFMDEGHETLVKDQKINPEVNYPQTLEFITRKINFLNGKIATENTPASLVKKAIFIKGKAPIEVDNEIVNIGFENSIKDFDAPTLEKLKNEIREKLMTQRLEAQALTASKTIDSEKTSEELLEEDGVLQNPLSNRFKIDLNSVRPKKDNWQTPVVNWRLENPEFLENLGGITDRQYNEIQKIIEVFKENQAQEKAKELLLTREPVFVDPKSIRTGFPPQIKILHPKNNSTIGTGEVKVQTSISAQNGIRNVKFYFDGKLLQNLRTPPYTAKFNLPSSLKNKSRHRIRVTVEDRAGKIAQKEISVIIGTPSGNAEIIFLGPTPNQRIIQNSQIEILAQISEGSSKIEKVEFFLDENSLGKVQKRPYRSQFIASGNLGRHTLQIKTIDTQGSESQKSIPVIFTRESLQRTKSPTISKIQAYRNSLSIDVFFPNPENIISAELIISQAGKTIFQSNWEDMVKYKQIQVPLSIGSGSANLQLIYQEKGSLELQKSSIKRVKL